MVLIRLYRFKRRCGMSRRLAFTHALQAVLRDIKLKKGPL